MCRNRTILQPEKIKQFRKTPLINKLMAMFSGDVLHEFHLSDFFNAVSGSLHNTIRALIRINKMAIHAAITKNVSIKTQQTMVSPMIAIVAAKS
jgi:hypothetical protein